MAASKKASASDPKVAQSKADNGQSSKDVAVLGQVFTPPSIVDRLLALRRNTGRALDPAAGDGAFSSRIPGCTAIEIDPAHCPPEARNINFFSLPESEQFATWRPAAS